MPETFRKPSRLRKMPTGPKLHRRDSGKSLNLHYSARRDEFPCVRERHVSSTICTGREAQLARCAVQG